jgi:hypothetical protein
MASDSNEQIDRLLRRVFKTDPATAPVEDCPDAEVLGAWVDGRLTGAMQSAAISHLSTCSRCQSIVAELSRMEPTPATPAWWRRGLRVQWLVPATAAAAALVIWFVVPSAPPSTDRFEPAREAASRTEPEPTAPVTPPAPPASGQASPAAESLAERQRTEVAPPVGAFESLPAPAVARDQRSDLSADRAAPMQAEQDRAVGAIAARKERPEARAAAAPPGAAPAAPAEAAASRGLNETMAVTERKAALALTVTSPDRSVAWRIERDGVISRSADGGSTWDTVADGLAVNVLAGASPSPNVCWLVGRGGAVLLTIDGRRFTRLPFPDGSDLSAVQATDGRIAQVATSGGRIFRTTDGGQTWAEARPQDF